MLVVGMHILEEVGAQLLREVTIAAAARETALVPLELERQPVELPHEHTRGLCGDAEPFDEPPLRVDLPVGERNVSVAGRDTRDGEHDVQRLRFHVAHHSHANFNGTAVAVAIHYAQLMTGDVRRAQSMRERSSERRRVVLVNGAGDEILCRMFDGDAVRESAAAIEVHDP